jgi:hypothetical protein
MSGSFHARSLVAGRSGLAARRSSVAATALLLAIGSAHAIEAPQPRPASPPPPAQSQLDVTPTDETTFYELLQRVTNHRNLRGLDVPDSAIAALARGDADVAVATLDELAGQGNLEANVALVRIQHWCGRISSSPLPEPQVQIAQLGEELSVERASRAAGVIRAQAEFTGRARVGCSKAEFDYGDIEARLRSAAAAGHPASATELAQFVRDPARRQALLQAAADKNYAPALHAIATNLLIAVQRGETTEHVSEIRRLLKLAGRSLPKAKLDLANCMALGCDGHPADALGARAFGIDAARDGEPIAFLSMVRMPWGGRLSRVELLAWQYFGDRLNEAGCMGDGYVGHATSFAHSIRLLEKAQDPQSIEAAKAKAETLWRNNSERAKKENGCG